jgi:sec-independent protein translocase protein TatB
MFEVGFTEIVLIFGIALLVLGPARLPKLAADLGRWAGRARAMARQLRTQLEQETQFDPLADINKPASTSASSSTIHTPPPTPAATVDDDSSRAAPAQLADESSAPAEPVTIAGEAPATSEHPTRDASPPPGHDGR